MSGPQVYQEEELRVRVAVTAGENTGFQFKTHPNIDKTLYAEQSVLGLKDPSRPFPAGNPLGILKWRYQVCDPCLQALHNVLSNPWQGTWVRCTPDLSSGVCRRAVWSMSSKLQELRLPSQICRSSG